MCLGWRPEGSAEIVEGGVFDFVVLVDFVKGHRDEGSLVASHSGVLGLQEKPKRLYIPMENMLLILLMVWY